MLRDLIFERYKKLLQKTITKDTFMFKDELTITIGEKENVRNNKARKKR